MHRIKSCSLFRQWRREIRRMAMNNIQLASCMVLQPVDTGIDGISDLGRLESAIGVLTHYENLGVDFEAEFAGADLAKQSLRHANIGPWI